MIHLVESLRRIAILLQPFLTRTPNEIFKQLGLQDESFKTWDGLERFGDIPSGTKVEKGEPIFPRLEIADEVAFIKTKMQGSSEYQALQNPHSKEVKDDVNNFADDLPF